MRARPADAVRVIEIEMQALVGGEEPAKRRQRGRIAVHAVDAVGEVPDAPVLCAERARELGEAIRPAVAHESADGPYRLQRRQHRLDAGPPRP